VRPEGIKRKATMPPQLSGMARNMSLNIIGVTLTTNLLVSDHIPGVLGKCSQTLYALRVLRSHGLCDAGLQTVFHSVMVPKLLYASSAWSGFTTADDRQRVNAFQRRGKRCGFFREYLPMFEELLDNRDEQLFNKIMNNTQHVLYSLLPPPSAASQHYQLRQRVHNRQLPQHTGRL